MTIDIDKKIDILSAYQQVGRFSSLYDGMMTNSTFFGRFAIRHFWQMSDKKYLEFINQTFAGIPKDFSGRLLEIPIGTGILSKEVYKSLSNAEIIGVDYSGAMLSAARKNLKHLKNVRLIQGDVENLTFDAESFDIVLSVNGFHVFPNKQAAYSETYRVLKMGGVFCGSMYVQGENQRTDFFVKNFCERFNYFTSPHETISSLNERLRELYRQVQINHVEAFASFICKK